MNTILVLAMHGAPPKDFPRMELAEFMDLHHRLEHTISIESAPYTERYRELLSKIRGWPRNAENDPFHAGSVALAKQLELASGLPVVLGFNEFCAPSLEEALEQAAARADQVFVVTPMMTRGGEHSEQDIPAAIRRAQELYPDVEIRGVWPFNVEDIARFLAGQVKKLR